MTVARVEMRVGIREMTFPIQELTVGIGKVGVGRVRGPATGLEAAVGSVEERGRLRPQAVGCGCAGGCGRGRPRSSGRRAGARVGLRRVLGWCGADVMRNVVTLARIVGRSMACLGYRARGRGKLARAWAGTELRSRRGEEAELSVRSGIRLLNTAATCETLI